MKKIDIWKRKIKKEEQRKMLKTFDALKTSYNKPTCLEDKWADTLANQIVKAIDHDIINDMKKVYSKNK